MSILIFILKIIGILLLVILILIALFLFHPIFYQIKGEVEEEVSAEGYFWWLFQILRLEFHLEDGKPVFRIRIFGFSKDLGQDDEKDTEVVREAESEPERKPTGEAQGQIKTIEEAPKLPVSEKNEKSSIRRNKNVRKQKGSSKEKKKSPEKKKSDWKEKLLYWKKEAADKRNHQAISHLWKEFWYLLSHLKPNYFQAEISFSTGDPAVTGEVTGALSLLPIMYRYDAHFYPDFLSEEFYVRGNLRIKGHMALFHFLKSLIRLFLDKNMQRLYRKFKS